MSAKSPQPKTYQQLSQELAELMDWFESADANLDQAIAKYQQALELLDQMEAYLKTAQNKLQKISPTKAG